MPITYSRQARRWAGAGTEGEAEESCSEPCAETRGPKPPAVEEETVEGLYSAVPSRVSSMGGTPCNIAFDFISPPNGKLGSIYGYAGIWDSGQLTPNHVVIRESVFNFWFGTDMDPYNEVRIEGAGGDLLDLISQTKIGNFRFEYSKAKNRRCSYM